MRLRIAILALLPSLAWGVGPDSLLAQIWARSSVAAAATVSWTDPNAAYLAFAFCSGTNASGVADLSPYARHAAIVGGLSQVPIGTNVNGRVQYGLALDGSGYANIGSGQSDCSNFLAGVTQMIMVAWVSVTNWTDYDGVLMCYNGTSAELFGLRENTAVSKTFRFTALAGTALAATNQPTATWTMLVGRMNVNLSQALRSAIYVNTTLVSQSINPVVPLVQGDYLRIGFSDDDAGRKFQGWMGPIFCYTNLTFTDTMVTNLYLNTHPTNCILSGY